jgi:CheY-like chemotaxis protein
MKTILQVEDDPNDVLFLQYAIKKVGLANPVHVASHGQEAIDYLQGVGKFADREQFPLPSLVLLDLKLPYVMGLEVLKWIRRNLQPPPIVIVLTSSALEADVVAAYELGANAYLTKPSAPAQLQDLVRALQHFWLTHNKFPAGAFGQPPARPTRSINIGPGPGILPGASVSRHQAGLPAVTPQMHEKYEKNLSVDL